MKYTVYDRYDGNAIGPNSEIIYKTSKVSYRWKRNVELAIRYLRKFHPEISNIVLAPYPREPSFGVFFYDPGGDRIAVKTKCAHFIPYDDIENVYNFKTRTQKKWAMRQIVNFLTDYDTLRKGKK